MPRLIVLNGPPGIGKSTIAQLYVERHPGVLNLDIDQVVRLIGGGRGSAPNLALARSDALAMAREHLTAGLDVVVPQFVGVVRQLERFEAAALATGADFLHLVLMDSRERALERFAERGLTTKPGWVAEIHDDVVRQGGDSFLAAMYDALSDVIRTRPASVVLSSTAGATQQTYDLVDAALGQ